MSESVETPQGLPLEQRDHDIAAAIERAVREMLARMFSIHLDTKPIVKKVAIIKWMNRLNLLMPFGYRFASVILYRFGPKKSVHHVDGFLVLFVPESVAEALTKMMGHSPKDVDDILDGMGELCNIIAGSAKVGLVKAGYVELNITVPLSFQVDVDELFDYTENEKLEMTFQREGEDFLRVEVAISPKVLIKREGK